MTAAPVRDGWADEYFIIYQHDRFTAHGSSGTELVLRWVDPLDQSDPPCIEGSGGDFCGGSAGHEHPHIRVSADLLAAGFRVVTVIEP